MATTTSELHDAPLPPVWKRRWFVPAMAGLALLLMAGLAVLAVAFSFWAAQAKARREVAAEVARIQAAGEPITVDDFYKWHQVPPGTPDVTQTWLQVLAMLNGKCRSDGAQLPIVGQGDKASLAAEAENSKLAEAEAYLAERAAIIAAAHQAAQQPGECRYPVKFEDGVGALLKHAQDIRGLARLLSLDLRVKLERGDAAAAVVSLEAIIVTGQTLQHQPTLVEQLVRMAVLGVALHDAEFALNRAALSAAQLKALSAQIAAVDVQAGMTNGMLGERGIGYHSFHHLETLGDVGSLNAPNAGPMIQPSNGKLTRPEDCLLYIDYMNGWIEASRQPFPACLQQSRAVEDRLKHQVGSAGVVDKIRFMVTFLMLPATGAAFDAGGRLQAQRDLLLSAIAAERYRQQAGAWPTQLSDLVPAYLPALPSDPFDGQPLRMKTAGDEILLYSVGADGKDDGGVETETSAKPDIVVRVKAAKGS